MARQPRRKSITGIHHVMLRGINHENVFHGPKDYVQFLQIVGDCKGKDKFELLGFCLMGNHLHLLIKTTAPEIGHVMKRISLRYVTWYNLKYKREGPVFQGRFKSRPVEDDGYFLTALRHIHQTPARVGVVSDLSMYHWSSYRHYIGMAGVVDRAFALSLLAVHEFIDYHKQDGGSADCLDMPVPKNRINDDEAIAMITDSIGHSDITKLQQLEPAVRSNFLRTLRGCGMSIRQISRLTGFGKSVVERA